MDTKAVLQEFEKVAMEYIDELTRYRPDQFTHKPASDEWSLGQVYQHLITTSYSQIKLIETIIAGEGETGGEKSDWAEQLFEKGAFPPIKIKLPERPELTPENLGDPQQVENQLLGLMEKMRQVETKLASAPPQDKMRHPRLGWLTALEWFQLIPMHFRHHLRQKKRLDEVV
jgi:hypothetical protein